jgi:hypothetical protein
MPGQRRPGTLTDPARLERLRQGLAGYTGLSAERKSMSGISPGNYQGTRMRILRRIGVISLRSSRWPTRFAVPTALAMAIAAIGMVLGPGVPAMASVKPHFFSWKPGTAMPAIPAGYHVVALPSSKVLAQLKPGQNLPVSQISDSAAFRAKAASLAAARDNEPVNLELVPNGPPNCHIGDSFIADLGYSWANVGESFSEIPNVEQGFQYSVTQSQSTTFGVGLSVSGDVGSFSYSGTTTTSTDRTGIVTFPRETGVINNAWGTTFEIGKFRYTDSCLPTDDYYYIEPYEWTTGAKVTHPTSVPALSASNCRSFAKGSSFQANSSNALTIAHGYDVKGGTTVNEGFTGSAQTGYSTNAQVGFTFNQAGYLCGNNAPPPDAGVYVAHA